MAAPDVNIRRLIVAALKPVLPARWRLLPYAKNLDAVDRTTVTLTLVSIERHRDAPNGKRLATYVLSIVSPRTDPETVDDDLEDSLIDLLEALDNLEPTPIVWTKAIKGRTDNEQNIGYDIDFEFPYNRQSHTETEA